MYTVKQQFEAMLQRGTIPCIEYQTSPDDWLLVEVGCNDKGVVFSFDSDNKPVFFDGGIVKLGDGEYCVPFDEYFCDLIYYLQLITENMIDGFLIPNGLYYVEDGNF